MKSEKSASQRRLDFIFKHRQTQRPFRHQYILESFRNDDGNDKENVT